MPVRLQPVSYYQNIKIYMARSKVVDEVEVELVEPIALITQEFGNGDMNVLRDKINELISAIS